MHAGQDSGCIRVRLRAWVRARVNKAGGRVEGSDHLNGGGGGGATVSGCASGCRGCWIGRSRRAAASPSASCAPAPVGDSELPACCLCECAHPQIRPQRVTRWPKQHRAPSTSISRPSHPPSSLANRVQGASREQTVASVTCGVRGPMRTRNARSCAARTSREKQTVMSRPPKFLPSMPRIASSASRRSPDAYSTKANPRGRLRAHDAHQTAWRWRRDTVHPGSVRQRPCIYRMFLRMDLMPAGGVSADE